MGPSLAGEDLRSLSLTPRGDVLLSARIAVRIGKDAKGLAIPSDKPGIPEPLEHIEAAVIAQGGSLLAADDKKHRVYRFDSQFQYQGTFPDAKERSISRMIVDGEGAIVMLDRDEKFVRVFDEAGHPLRSLALRGSGYEIKHPTDIAVDPVRNTYVAEEEGGVYVFTPSGQLLVVIGSGEQLRKPRAITLDASGALLAYDDKAEKVVRFK
jgi:DNA-binding beta-propeller fold protein YncE